MKQFTGFQGSLDGVIKGFWKMHGLGDPTFGAHLNHKEFSIEDTKMMKTYLHDPMHSNIYDPDILPQALFFFQCFMA